MKKILHTIFICILFNQLIFIPLSSFGQSETIVVDTAAPVILPFAIADIPVIIGTFQKRLTNADKIIAPKPEMLLIDSVFQIQKVYLIETKEDFDATKKLGMSSRNLQNSKREWQNYHSQLQAIQNNVNERNKVLQELFEEINLEQRRWELTNEIAQKEKIATELISSTKENIEVCRSFKVKIRSQQDEVLLLFKNISEQIFIADETIKIIDERIKEMQSKLFRKDSPAIWFAFDSTSTVDTFKNKIIPSLENNYRMIKVYLGSRIPNFYYQMIFIILLILTFIFLKRKAKLTSINYRDLQEVRSALIVIRPAATAITLGLLISIFFYDNRPMPLSEFIIFLILFPIGTIIPTILRGNAKRYYFALAFLFVIGILHSYVFVYSGFNRLILLLETSLLILVLFGIRKQREGLNLPKKGFWIRAINLTLIIYITALFIAIISNITGHVNFAQELFRAIISSSVTAIITYIVTVTISSLILVITKEKTHQPFQVISRYQNFLKDRIRPLIEVFGFIFWVYLTMISFSVFEHFIKWLGLLMDKSWILGETEISLGGIISFLFVLIITFTLVRMVKVLFQDEFLKKSKIPRGVPEAISMTLRYVIIGFGFYLAISAAGVDLSKFSLIAGALGVGIGFGLQNIVANFIAGLVLSYERPIHVGDTIEVEQLMGNVTEIGVRSSKIKTFDGSEVIVPNGNLIANQVINWTLSDQRRRLTIPVRTSLEADPSQIIKLLKEIAAAHPNTLPNPEPMALFNGYGESSLDFTLYFWVYFNVGLGTKSDVALEIYKQLKEKDIHVPIPVRKIYYANAPNPPQD